MTVFSQSNEKNIKITIFPENIHNCHLIETMYIVTHFKHFQALQSTQFHILKKIVENNLVQPTLDFADKKKGPF